MKYILKKDLPFAKAGAIINHIVNDGLTIQVNNRYCDICLANKDEWIEPIKPRRIRAFFNEGGTINAYSGDVIKGENVVFMEVAE